ncbi:hypothetical protein SM124_15520 [Bacillus sp. 31A1R]|uniref:Uncharacterized protein n=1 Tax=Robertmurraya mangrovi TaxID=3098077 RepID=A0ABU5J142_9BACI|nr:hypothetical protein [Bacillus sp. 31A1R]MDZ5473127.1 hypothetical protein [Bacillus sp. 31A1R]
MKQTQEYKIVENMVKVLKVRLLNPFLTPVRENKTIDNPTFVPKKMNGFRSYKILITGFSSDISFIDKP